MLIKTHTHTHAMFHSYTCDYSCPNMSSNQIVYNHQANVSKEVSTYQWPSNNRPSCSYELITSNAIECKKRKRVITLESRRSANIRERRRMFHLNNGFDELRKRIPKFSYEKQLSRIETLRLAIFYINLMSELLESR